MTVDGLSDLTNASCWYRQAGRDRSTASFEEEWEQVAGRLLH